MPAASTSMLSVQVSDFKDNCLLIQHDRLICDFCSSGQRFACGFLQSTPHDGNLAVRLTLPPVGCVEDFHLQVSAPCRAHNKKAAPFLALLSLYFYLFNEMILFVSLAIISCSCLIFRILSTCLQDIWTLFKATRLTHCGTWFIPLLIIIVLFILFSIFAKLKWRRLQWVRFIRKSRYGASGGTFVPNGGFCRLWRILVKKEPNKKIR